MYLLFSFTIGGAEKLVVDLCNEMASKHQEVHLYIVNDYYSNALLKALDKRVHVKLQNRKIGKGEKITTVIRIAKYIIQNEIDVIHCNSLNAPELLLLKPILYRNSRVIFTVHDVGQYGTLSKWKVLIRNILCDSFIAISESVRQDMVEAGANGQKISVVYNAINLSEFQGHNGKMFDRKHVIIGNVARMMPEKKGQDILIEAIEQIQKKYPEIVCEFAGGCDVQHEKAYEMLKRNVVDKNLSRNIVFRGTVIDVPSFLEKIDIFVLPSRFEGFGISLIEAMSMGIPCIASDLDGPAEIIGDNDWGELFPVGDVNALAFKIDYIIEHYDEYQERQAGIKKYVHERFDICRMSDCLLKIYMGKNER